ncbi:MAG TPA: hypothetical protein VF484_10805 [Candidatus Limnocylindrales bacterium]
MDRTRTRLAVVAGTTLAIALAAPVALAGRPHSILEFETMVGVTAGLTGAQSQAPLRGLSGGGIPWTLSRAKGSLDSAGNLKIEVTGLVLASGANAGTNPIATFKGLVSCVNADGSFSNIATGTFPATTGPATAGGGNADIEATVTLPSPCIAPIVFVTSSGGSWFAATGN